MTSTLVDRLDGLSSSTAVKGPCRVATTANITLSGTQTIDGVSVVADDRVLVKDQSTASENGIYVASASTWRRSKDFDSIRDVKKGTRVYITDGTTHANAVWSVSSSNPINVGTDSITFQAASTAEALALFNETNKVSPVLADRVAGSDSENSYSAVYYTHTAIKALYGVDPVFYDGTDGTKRVSFDVSGITAGQTRGVSWPDTDGTVVLAAATQTLTDKTLTTPVITQPTLTLKNSAGPTPTAEADTQWDSDDNVIVVGDGSGQKIFAALPDSVASGDMLYMSGAKTASRVAIGTQGQVWTVNAGATAPEWSASPGVALIGEDEPTSDVSSIPRTGLSAYRDIEAVFGMQTSAAGGTAITVQARASGGTWRDILLLDGGASVVTVIGELKITNFGRSNNVKIVTATVYMTTSQVIDRSNAVVPGVGSDATSYVHMLTWDEQWDEVRFVPDGQSIEGSNADDRAYVAWRGIGAGD